MRAFAKYEGTGNDFIIFDDPSGDFPETRDLIAHLCNRRLGIGADGLILIRPSEQVDYEMVYFNADGFLGSMCGNGARCAFDFVRRDNGLPSVMTFAAYDGLHQATMVPGDWISVSMQDVVVEGEITGDCVLDTGSPHYVRFVKDLATVNVYEEGRSIRHLPPYMEQGINVNFVEHRGGKLHMATFERGVENITLSCGTGAVAAALTYALRGGLAKGPVDIVTPGGPLRVDFAADNTTFRKVVLQGPVRRVFAGQVELI